MIAKSLVIAFATLIAGNSSFAAEKIGDISCNVLKSSNLSVTAEIYGKTTDDEMQPTFINLQLVSYNKKNRQTKVVKNWDKVPAAKSGAMSLIFEDSKVRMEAYGDDVGAMSELSYEGTSLQLQCQITSEEESLF